MDTSDAALASFFNEVDGSTLSPSSESTYKATKVPVTYALELPLPVVMVGSTVRYAFSTEKDDISFAVYIRHADINDESEDVEETELLSPERVDSGDGPITGSFVVTEAPVTVLLSFDNNYSWLRSKVLSYSVTIKPPSESVTHGARLERIKAGLDNARVDRSSALMRLDKVVEQGAKLSDEIARMEIEIEQKRVALAEAEKEKIVLEDRARFRDAQIDGLERRLEQLERRAEM